MPHAALTRIRSVEDAASYWESRLDEIAAAKRADEMHWSRVHPPNVHVLIRNTDEEESDALNDWLDTHTGRSHED